MKMKKIALVCSVLLLSGCVTTADDVRVQTDDVDVRIKTNNNSEGYDFCPPGQAKKGNC
jgi:starvation-inducible outer membrane lipoprotein